MPSEDKNKNKDENKNMLLEYMEDVDDKLFKEYSDDDKSFNNFIDKFDRATNEEDNEKVVKELKDINTFVKLKCRMIIMNTNVNYLILLKLLIIFCMNTPKNE